MRSAGDRAASFARSADQARLARLFAVVEDVLEDRLGPERGQALCGELYDRMEPFRPYLLGDVNPARPDASSAWDDARAAAYLPTEHVGAVHLELGTWTAFPAARVRELVAAGGLSEFVRLDSDPRYDADVVADATALPFRSGTIDRVASNSVLEHIAYPHDVLRETLRVLRPGGVMVAVMPFVWHQHGYPDDYVRLTPGFFDRICPELGFVDVRVDIDTSGGLYNTLHNAMKMARPDMRHREAAAMRELQELATLLLGALIPFDYYFEGESRQWFHSVRVLARKPGIYEPSGRPREDSHPFAERALDLLADPKTKQPLRLEGRWLRAQGTDVAYPLSRGGASVSFLEPRIDRATLRDRVKQMARRATH